jgi:hypothetical protein
MLVLLRGFQSYIFSAGGLGEVPARDDFLKVLCETAVTPAAMDEAGSSGSGEGQVGHLSWLVIMVLEEAVVAVPSVSGSCATNCHTLLHSSLFCYRVKCCLGICKAWSFRLGICKVCVFLPNQPSRPLLLLQAGLRTSNASVGVLDADMSVSTIAPASGAGPAATTPGLALGNSQNPLTLSGANLRGSWSPLFVVLLLLLLVVVSLARNSLVEAVLCAKANV